MIGIIDNEMGNLRSVFNAIHSLGFEVTVVSDPAAAASCEHLILPGVGSFANAANNLRHFGFDSVIRKHVADRKPFLGICLGMQLLATRGHEPLLCDGLSLIPGEVVPLVLPAPFKIPHVGWNQLHHLAPHPIFEGVKTNVDFYFVHSYHFLTERPEDRLTLTDCSLQFTSTVAHASIVGVQFHPEKSQDNGLRILKNFCSWDGTWETSA